MQLHETFFSENTYKTLRNLIDDHSPEAERKLTEHLETESEELTDFLNFFELIAYFERIGTITFADVSALLGYYLKLMVEDKRLLAYLSKDELSFEHLHRLLLRIDAR